MLFEKVKKRVEKIVGLSVATVESTIFEFSLKQRMYYEWTDIKQCFI